MVLFIARFSLFSDENVDCSYFPESDGCGGRRLGFWACVTVCFRYDRCWATRLKGENCYTRTSGLGYPKIACLQHLIVLKSNNNNYPFGYSFTMNQINFF